MRAWQWLPTLVAALVLTGLVGAIVARRQSTPTHHDFPPALIPQGARVVTVREATAERCYAHLVATLEDAGAPSIAAWAAGLDLPCAAPTAECTGWSTEARRSPFWSVRRGDVDGLDSVAATLSGATLTIDWGDYLCSGPN